MISCTSLCHCVGVISCVLGCERSNSCIVLRVWVLCLIIYYSLCLTIKKYKSKSNNEVFIMFNSNNHKMKIKES